MTTHQRHTFIYVTRHAQDRCRERVPGSAALPVRDLCHRLVEAWYAGLSWGAAWGADEHRLACICGEEGETTEVVLVLRRLLSGRPLMVTVLSVDFARANQAQAFRGRPNHHRRKRRGRLARRDQEQRSHARHHAVWADDWHEMTAGSESVAGWNR